MEKTTGIKRLLYVLVKVNITFDVCIRKKRNSSSLFYRDVDMSTTLNLNF